MVAGRFLIGEHADAIAYPYPELVQLEMDHRPRRRAGLGALALRFRPGPRAASDRGGEGESRRRGCRRRGAAAGLGGDHRHLPAARGVAAGGAVLDHRSDRRGAACSGRREPRRRRRQRPRLHRAESRPGAEPGGDARRLRRPDRPRPARGEGAGRYLSRRLGDLAVAVHARYRSLRHVARRGAARTSGHALRFRFAFRNGAVHLQPAGARK